MKETEWQGVKMRSVFLVFYLLFGSVQSILAVCRAGEGGAGGGQWRLSFQVRVPPICWRFTQAVYPLHKDLQLGVQGLESAGQSTNQRPVRQVRQLRNLGNKEITEFISQQVIIGKLDWWVKWFNKQKTKYSLAAASQMLLFSVLYQYKLSSFGFWTIGQTKQATRRLRFGFFENHDSIVYNFMTYYKHKSYYLSLKK